MAKIGFSLIGFSLAKTHLAAANQPQQPFECMYSMPLCPISTRDCTPRDELQLKKEKFLYEGFTCNLKALAFSELP
jgi:hypothetical protein